MEPSPLLKLIEVTKRYDSPDNAAPLTVLNRISLEVRRGESLAIVGPSGSGKSTLLHIMGTLDRPTSGSVTLDGQDLSSLDEASLAAVRNRQIGFVFQSHYLLPQCTVLENVLVPTLARSGRHKEARIERSKVRDQKSESADGTRTTHHAPRITDDQSLTSAPTEPAEQRANRLLARVGLADRFSHRPGQLSGGERQRVAVVRALINRPQLLLADEPTGSLDHTSAHELAQLLLELNREENVTLIVVTHALELARRMGRILELKGGRLV